MVKQLTTPGDPLHSNYRSNPFVKGSANIKVENNLPKKSL